MAGERALEYAKRAGLNKYYLPVVEVALGGVSFNVFGSMSWTVAYVRSLEWVDIRKAYIAITGDVRDDVNDEAAMNVVAGELQKHWAKYHGRDDLELVIDEQQESRIAFAMQDTPAIPAGSPSAGNSRTARREEMAKKKAEKAKDAPEKKAKKVAETPQAIPSRGASGFAAKMIAEGKTDRATVMAAVQEAFPTVKNVAPAVSYAARCCGVVLT